MNAPAPLPGKQNIMSFFKAKPKQNQKPDSSQTASMTVGCKSIEVGEPSVISSNVISVLSDRTTYLNDKELALLKTFLEDIEVDHKQFLTEDVRNDESFMSILKRFVYVWDKFNLLRKEYQGGKTLHRKSVLFTSLDDISKVDCKTVKLLFEEVGSYSIKAEMSSFLLSQTYLKKAESLVHLLTELGKFKDMVCDQGLLNNLRRRISQQNSSVNKLFVRSTEELLEFFCENDTRLTWDHVTEDLIEHLNANTDFKTITVDELLSVASQLSGEIVTDVREIKLTLTPEKIRSGEVHVCYVRPK